MFGEFIQNLQLLPDRPPPSDEDCNPDNELCDEDIPLNGLDQAFSPYALKVMFITSMFKFGVPLSMALNMIEYEADTDTYDDDYHLETWLEDQDVTETTMAWLEVAGPASVVYMPMTTLFAFFFALGVFDKSLKFWIEHVVSNLNWIIYVAGILIMYQAALVELSPYGWLSAVGYFLFAFFSYRNDYFFGTQAIRYLDNEYYSDPYLVPSVLYLFGLRSHKESELKQTKSDPSHVDDKPID